MKTFKVSDLCTGKSCEVELVRETKWYYTVKYTTPSGITIHKRFHRATMCIEWEHLVLRVSEAA